MSTQGERVEALITSRRLAHVCLKIGDNNNNPYTEPFRPRRLRPLGPYLEQGSFMTRRPSGGLIAAGSCPASEGGGDAGWIHAAQPHAVRLHRAGDSPATEPQECWRKRAWLWRPSPARATEPPPDSLAGMVINLDGPPRRTADAHFTLRPVERPALRAVRPVFDYYFGRGRATRRLRLLHP